MSGGYGHGDRWYVCRGYYYEQPVWFVYAPHERLPHSWFYEWRNAIAFATVAPS